MSLKIEKTKVFATQDQGENILGICSLILGNVTLTFVKPKENRTMHEKESPEAQKEIIEKAKKWCGIYKYNLIGF